MLERERERERRERERERWEGGGGGGGSWTYLAGVSDCKRQSHLGNAFKHLEASCELLSIACTLQRFCGMKPENPLTCISLFSHTCPELAVGGRHGDGRARTGS